MATKKPTGLAIKNDGNKFTLSWKKGETYGDGIRLEYEYGYAKGNSVKRAKSGTLKLSGSAHNKVIKITKDKLTYVSFRVRGKANGEVWSAWAEKEFTIQEPKTPTLEAVWDENRPNETVFNWTASESTHRLFTRAEYQSIWVENCPDDIHAETLWSSAGIVSLTNKSGSITETEADTSGSHARIVRVRSYGLGGYSAWRYAYHVYAIPFEPVITSIDAAKGEYYILTVKYTQQSNEMQHPVGSTAVEYCYGVPSANYEPPLNAQWNPLTTPVDRGDNTWQGIIYTSLNDDEMLWVRVSATYDRNTVVSGYEVIDYGELAEPSNLSTTPNISTHTVAVTATNNSQQADSVLAVIYQDPITNESAIMGVIPHGSTTATVVVPAWSDSVGKIGVQAISGQYTAQPARPDGVITYDFKVWVQSQIKWSGTPQAPEITVTRANDDTAAVMWSWPYENADKAEISWSDRPDAWESTEEPETYEVSNLHASKWNVGGLDLGKTWYFRVRLFYTSGDANIYGTYSRTATLDLSSEPDKPVLSLTDTVIDEAGVTTASWGYISTDGTPQTRAELARVYYGEVWNYTIFDAVASQQHYVIDAKQLGVESGEQVPIAVRVYSASGQVSAWSDPVTLTIADPLTCTIAQDSLEYDTTEINPETYEGDIVTLDGGTDNVKDVTALTVSLSPVQAGTGTPSPDNIRPITGHDTLNSHVTDVNVWDEEWEVGGISSVTGGNITNNSVFRSKNYISVVDGKSYYMKSGTNDTIGLKFYDAGKNIIGDRAVNANQIISTYFPAGTRYIRFVDASRNTYNNDISINYPSTDHDYHAYTGTTYETDLEQTVYGGDADVVNGTGTSEWANIASYNGETITEPWLSSMDAYSAGATPTTGAQVVYKLATPTDLTFTPQQVSLNSGTNNVWSDAGDVTVEVADAVESGYYLTEMPLSVTVTGAGTAGRTTALIERAEDYVMDRPDETVTAGHAGQVVAQAIQTGEEQIIFALDNLIGKLDDGARYNLVAITQDNLGRTARDIKEFTVRWAHQAVMASGTAVIENSIAKLTVTQPAGALATDTVDIYRLSQDRPELVVSGAAFGDTWVDPYPAVGTGGYRFVLITANGDYITADDVPSWVDVPASLDNMSHIIDFNGIEIILSHNIKIDNGFEKDFEAVQYLGGSIKGYWKRGVRRSGGADAVVVTDDPDLIKNLRRLAVYEGHCHVRTADGSSYTADVQVNDDEGFDTAGKIYSCSLDITKIDPIQPDGVLLTDWEAS